MERILKQIRINFGIVGKKSSFLNKNLLMMLYNFLIKSYLTYCLSSWYFRNTIIIQKLQCIVKSFIQLVLNLNYRASVSYIMKDNEIMSVEKLFEFELQTLCTIMFCTSEKIFE